MHQSIAVFLGVAFGLSYLGQIIVWLGGGVDGRVFSIIAPVLMFSPAVGAFAAMRVERQSFRGVLRGAGRPRDYAAGILIPAVTALAASLVIHGWLGGTPPAVELRGSAVLIPERSAFLGSGDEPFLLFVLDLIATSTLYAVGGALLALGEEIGWRGYLQPRLTEKHGLLSGTALVGVLWWLWHVPVLLQGYVFPDAPVLGAFVLFPVVAVMLSFFLGWLREGSKSIWPATLAHGSYNAAFATFVFTMDFGERTLGAYAVIVGLTAVTGSIFALLLAMRSRRGATVSMERAYVE